MKMPAEFIFLFVLFVIAIILFAQYGFRYVIGYRITEKDIRIMLFDLIPLERFPFENVVEVDRISFSDTMIYKSKDMFLALRLGNRIWGPIVMIRRNARIFRVILISPDSPEEFVSEASRRLQHKGGSSRE